MSVELLGRVGGQRRGDGADAPLRLGNQGDLVTSSMSGQHFEQMLRGRVVKYHIASQALLLAATTGGHPTVINPLGSGVLFVPLLLRLSFTSGTTVIGSVLLATTTGVTTAIATGGVIPTATLVTPVNGYNGSEFGSKLLWSPTTNTFKVAPTVTAATGINLAPADPVSGFGAEARFYGLEGYAPGTAMSVVYSVTSSVAIFHTTIYGLEVPLPLAA